MKAKGTRSLLRALYRRVRKFLHRPDDRGERALILECETEADVARLEREGDLLDLDVVGALLRAYRALDPGCDGRLTELGLSPEERYATGTEAECRGWIAEAETALATRPSDHEARIKPLCARVSLKREARRDELAARYPELTALGRRAGFDSSLEVVHTWEACQVKSVMRAQEARA